MKERDSVLFQESPGTKSLHVIKTQNYCIIIFEIVARVIKSFLSCKIVSSFFNPLSANPTKWSNTLKQLLPTNCLSVFEHFLGLALNYSISLTFL